MKTAETVALEKAIRWATRKTGVFGCYEVTIGFCGRERVDYMTYDTKGVFRCYEIKVSKADFHSAAAKSFVAITTIMFSQGNYTIRSKKRYRTGLVSISEITALRKQRNRIYPAESIKCAVRSMDAVQRYLLRG